MKLQNHYLDHDLSKSMLICLDYVSIRQSYTHLIISGTSFE